MSVRPAFLTDGFVPKVFRQVSAAVTASQKLPDADEQTFLQFSSEFQPAISALRSHAKSVLLKLVKFVNPQSTTVTYDDVVDASDECLENVSSSLDSHSLDSAQNQLGRLNTQQLLKYEYPFLKEVDNSLAPFVPKITRKPNARVPLDPAVTEAQRRPGLAYTKHPYRYEIEQLSLPESMKSFPEPQVPLSLDSTPFQFISTPDEFGSLLSELSTVNELAIDLEHHSVRSYQGIVCLMQVSTREKDYIVDTLALREHIPKLLDVMTDPNILKVFHGADSDVIWLQRDFGIYVVNMFDTGQAARELKMTSFSLAFLLKRLCHVDTDKSYQLADWRVRPLSSAMTQYARIDTHYLLYIYDRLKLDLVSKSRELHKNPDVLLHSAFQRSKDVCLRVFEKPNYMFMGIRRTGNLGYSAKRALEAVAQWRDALARKLDESPSFILTGESVLLVAATLPATAEELIARLRRPSPLLTVERANELVQLLNEFRDTAPSKPQVPASQSLTAVVSEPLSADWLQVTQLLKSAPAVRVRVIASAEATHSLFPLFDCSVSKPMVKSPIDIVSHSFESLLRPTVHCRPEDMDIEGEDPVAVAQSESSVVQPSTGDFIELKVPVDDKPQPIKRKQRDKHAIHIVPDDPSLLPAPKIKVEMTDLKVEPKLTKRRKLLRK